MNRYKTERLLHGPCDGYPDDCVSGAGCVVDDGSPLQVPHLHLGPVQVESEAQLQSLQGHRFRVHRGAARVRLV